MSEDLYPPMKWQWVIGNWTGDQAKSVIDHANAGISYFVLRDDSVRGSNKVMAAFRRPRDSPVPEHLQIATEDMARKLDRRYNDRHPTLPKIGS